MKRLALAAIAALILTTAATAQPPFDPSKRAAAIAPYIDAQTIAIVRFDLVRFQAADIARRLAAAAKLADADATRLIDRVQSLQTAMVKSGAREIYVLASFADVQSPLIVFVPLSDDGDAKKLFENLQPLFPPISNQAVQRSYAHKDGRFFAGSVRALSHLNGLKPEARPELEKAFAAAGDTAAQALLAPSADHHRVIEELLRDLPKEFGRISGKDLSAGMRWAAFGFNSGPKLALAGVVQSQDAAAAKGMRDFVRALLRQAGNVKGPDDKPLSDTFGRDFPKAIDALIPEVAGDRLIFRAGDEQVLNLLAKLYAIHTVAESQGGRMNNLKQIGLAIHNYADTYGALPPRAASKEPTAKPADRKPLLSWRVYLLPFIEQLQLYQEFHLDEPWDSEHNRKLIARMPPILQSGDDKLTAAGKTRFVAPMIKNAVFEPEGPGAKFAEITDGTSNTIMVIEATTDRAVVWTKPDDLPVDEKNPSKGVFNANESGALALFADGSVRFIKKSIDGKMLLYLFLRNDGSIVAIP